MVVNCSGAGENYIEQGGNRIQFIMFIFESANSKLSPDAALSRPDTEPPSRESGAPSAFDAVSFELTCTQCNTQTLVNRISPISKTPSLQRIDSHGLTVDQPK